MAWTASYTLTVLYARAACCQKLVYHAFVTTDQDPSYRERLRVKGVGTTLPSPQDMAALLSTECWLRLGLRPDAVVIHGQTYTQTATSLWEQTVAPS